MEVFDQLPLASLVNGQYLAMHGGISHRLQSLNDINDVNRVQEPDEDSLLTDLLWADPAKSKKAEKTVFKDNSERGISVLFGK